MITINKTSELNFQAAQGQRFLVHDGSHIGNWQYATAYYDDARCQGFEQEQQDMYLGSPRFFVHDLPDPNELSYQTRVGCQIFPHDPQAFSFIENEVFLYWGGYKWDFITVYTETVNINNNPVRNIIFEMRNGRRIKSTEMLYLFPVEYLDRLLETKTGG